MIERLWEAYKDSFYIGAAVSPKYLESKGEFIAKHFKSITAENQMKFCEVHREPQVYDFSVTDKMVSFAKAHQMVMRGHTLVWHQQTPEWVFKNPDGSLVAKEQLAKTMEDHIRTVAGRYKEDLYCWDVVNEAIDDGEGFLRDSLWLKILGEDFISKAFELAHEAAPKAILFYNDYNAVRPDKRDKIYKLVKGLLDKGTPIDGIGIQGHWNLLWPKEEEIRSAFEKYLELGLKLQITELDLSMYAEKEENLGLTAPTEKMLEQQADRYEMIFRLFNEYRRDITGVTFWGIADDYSWLDFFPVKGRKNWPLVFDENYEPKESCKRIISLS